MLSFQGVIEFALALFFAKLVAYTFLFWLPYYVRFHSKLYGYYLSLLQSLGRGLLQSLGDFYLLHDHYS